MVAPNRRRKSRPFRPMTHAIEALTMVNRGESIVVLARDAKQYYTIDIPREALGLLANQDIVDFNTEDYPDPD